MHSFYRYLLDHRSTQNQRLLHLSQSANNCKKVLNDKLKVARLLLHLSLACSTLQLTSTTCLIDRRVLQLSELSRKMETMVEQVLPFAPPEMEELQPDISNILGSPEKADDDDNSSKRSRNTRVNTHNGSSNVLTSLLRPNHTIGPTNAVFQQQLHQSAVLAADGTNTAIPPMERLANFYRKYNRVVLDNIAIVKEKERLQLENAQLQDLIQQYLSGTQLNNDVLSDDNPLFVVNGRCGIIVFTPLFPFRYIYLALINFIHAKRRANLNFEPPVRRATPVVQDAAVIQNTTNRHHAW